MLRCTGSLHRRSNSRRWSPNFVTRHPQWRADRIAIHWLSASFELVFGTAFLAWSRPLERRAYWLRCSLTCLGEQRCSLPKVLRKEALCHAMPQR